MIKPQHSRNTATTSQLTDQRNSRQKQQIEKILEEYQNIFQESNRVPMHCQVKHSIELVPGSSLPRTHLFTEDPFSRTKRFVGKSRI